MPIAKAQRWLDLIAFLVGRRLPVTAEQIMDHVPGYGEKRAGGADDESVRKAFERDKKELRELGIPLETVDFRVDGQPARGYRLAARDFYLPYLRLLREEGGGADAPAPSAAAAPGIEVEAHEVHEAVQALGALAALEGFPLRDDARSAVRKLTFDLVDDLDPGPPPHLATADGAEVHRRVDALSAAVMGRKRATFIYRGIARDRDTRRTVDPLGLLHKFGRWYLVAHDRDRDALRTFRVSRMSDVEVAPRPDRPDFERPEGLDLEAWNRSQAWNLPGEEAAAVAVEVRFEFPRSLQVERAGHGTLVRRADDGAQIRTFDVRQADPFLRWLLTFEGEARIESPAELVEAFRTLAGRVAALYPAAEEGDG